MAPIDIFSSLSKEWVKNFPPAMMSEKMRSQALDVEYHWVTELGQEARLTAGAVIKPTVSPSQTTRAQARIDRYPSMTSRLVRLWTSRSWARTRWVT